LAAVAYGKISPRLIANRIQPQEAEEGKGAGGLIKRSLGRLKRRPTEGVKVKGVDDVLVRYAKCCNPLPGDAVVGFITRGRGVTVHNRNCPSVKSVDPERLIELEWDVPENQLWQARILVETDGHTGVLADLTSVLKKREIAVLEADIKTMEDRRGISEFLIEVHDAKQLKQILSDLKNIKGVQAVRRQGIPG
jgi:GTP pyrophosphokinase